MEIVIAPDGTAHAVYGEEINLATLGSVEIHRASFLEPDTAGHWWADLSPVGGPKLGPFQLRSEGLEAERGWLSKHWLPSHSGRAGHSQKEI